MVTRLRSHPALADALVELHGGLGAGKTTFVRHLLRGLGVGGRIKSPTYTVVETYEAPATQPDGRPVQVSHFDFYRFDNPQELEDAGLRDLLAAPGLKLCEWPDKAAGHLPTPDLRLHIDWAAETDAGEETAAPATDTARRVRAEAFSPAGLALLR